MYSNKSANKPVKFMQQRAAAASARDRCGYKLCLARVDPRLERCAGSGNARSGACERNAATRRQSSGCFCSTYPAAHVSDTRMASARRSTGARLTFIKHSLTLVCAAHLHGLEPRDTVLVRKIEKIKVTVPDGGSFPEKVDLDLAVEGAVDKVGD